MHGISNTSINNLKKENMDGDGHYWPIRILLTNSEDETQSTIDGKRSKNKYKDNN